jgi:hypothetical protein
MTRTRNNTQTRTRTFRDTSAQAVAAAHIQKQNTTCEGCAHLRTYPRPMCQAEASPHFRTARDTYHPRCTWYGVRTGQGVK